MPLFVSVSIDDQDRLIVGSIYYDWGRYRLRHGHGPAREDWPQGTNITQFAENRVNAANRHAVDAAFLAQGPNIGPWFVDRAFIAAYQLKEYNHGNLVHTSRGAPVPMIRLTAQSQAAVNGWAQLVENNLPNPTNAIFDGQVLEVHLQ